jgi:7-cyano-7-deazaguanine synthase in queuosine biosynthesis
MKTPSYSVNVENEHALAIFSNDIGRSTLKRFSARTGTLSSAFGRQLPAILEDLIAVAVTAYVTDRAVRRTAPRGAGGSLLWQREFELNIPVADPSRWNQEGIRDLLSDSLGFLTEDRWRFRFSQRQVKYHTPLQQVLFPPVSPARVGLFSGGLDSLAGLALDLENQEGTVIAVTCATSSRLLGKQKQLLKALRKESPGLLVPLMIPVNLAQNRQEYNSNEATQRARGFLFCILGAVAALMAEVDVLSVYENGIGAINLPLSEAQLGAQSSRATNPIALGKIARLISELLGKDFSICLPYLFATKAQMCRDLGVSAFRHLAFNTVSCDSFPMRMQGPEHCGFCTSCLLRREALWSSGLFEDRQEGRYRYDLFSREVDLGFSKLAPWWDMLNQVERFDCALGSLKPWLALSIEFPEMAELEGALSNFADKSMVRARLLGLIKAYCEEWHRLPAYPQGWKFSAPELRLSA